MHRGSLLPVRLLLGALALTAVVAACGDGDAGTSSTISTTTTSAGDRSEQEDATRGTPAPSTDLGAPVQLVDLDLSLESPTAAAAVPGDGSRSVLVTERAGRVHEVVLDDGSATLVEGPLLDLTRQVGSTSSERGLLGVAVSPDASAVVVSYTAGEDGSNQVERYDLGGEPGALSVDPTSRRSLLSVEQPYGNHNGGHVEFGPDGMLYTGIGDGGSGGDPEGNAQDRSTLLGKILRLDATGSVDLVPADNPFVGAGDGSRPEIWLTGVRNPWRFSFDPATGDLWVADVGQNSQEEINRLAAAEGGGRGANLGWDLFEGAERFEDADPARAPWSDGPFVEPVHTYGREGGCSVTGGIVHDGRSVPSLQGAYVFADYCGEGVRALVLEPAGAEVAELDGTELDQIVAFAHGPSGEVLVLSLRSGMFELRPA